MATQKQITIIARYAHKTNGKLNGTVTYLVRSSNGKSTYCTTLIEGKSTGCSCPAKANCYHKKQLEQREQARKFAAKTLPTWAIELVKSEKLIPPCKVVPAMVQVPVQVSVPVRFEADTSVLNASKQASFFAMLPSRKKSA